MRFIVCAVEDWNKDIFFESCERFEGDVGLATCPDELVSYIEKDPTPEFIFFLHWRWRVPREIVESYNCICFHMTDLPFGRGGSPLQNLLIRDFRETVLTAFLMDDGVDTGPVLLKRPLKLNGSAREIYERSSRLAWEMIPEILAGNLKPEPQVGEVTLFKRRKESESMIPVGLSLNEVYNFIRMLDAPGYPSSFIEGQNLRVEFTEARWADGDLVATVSVSLLKEEKNDR